MRKIAIPVINGIEMQPYQRHPRILELRLLYIHSLLTSEYNDVFAMDFFKKWCDLNHINWTMISGIISQKARIQRLSVLNKVLYRQQVVFMGQVYNETRTDVAKKYLNVSKTYIYSKAHDFDVFNYVNEDWLNELDNSVVVCGAPAYKHEVERFIESIDAFVGVVGNVSVAKTRV